MPLTLRPTGLASPVDKNRQDFTMYSGDWAMGRICEQRGAPDHMPWFWSLHGVSGKPADMRTAVRNRMAPPARLGGHYRGPRANGWRCCCKSSLTGSASSFRPMPTAASIRRGLRRRVDSMWTHGGRCRS
jgi:hypothetical protein